MAEFDAHAEIKMVVIRDSGAVRATVKDPTQTPWTVIEDETGDPVEWEILAYAPCWPLVFPTREKAIEYANQGPCAKFFDWTFLTRSEVYSTGRSESTLKHKS